MGALDRLILRDDQWKQVSWHIIGASVVTLPETILWLRQVSTQPRVRESRRGAGR
jgi:hypothetical protein